MSRNHGLKKLLSIPCDDIWIGFDCGHLWDKRDIEALVIYYGKEYAEGWKMMFDGDHTATVKTFKFVESECKSIINQLIEKEPCLCA